MKLFLVFIIAAALYACGVRVKESPQLSNDTVKQPQYADTLQSINDNKSSEDEEEVVDTSWVAQLYTGSRDTLLYQCLQFSVLYTRQLNDSVSYCLFNLGSGVCSKTYLASQVWRKHRQLEEVSEGCDSDLSFPAYSYAEYVHDSGQHIITTTTYEERAKPEFLNKEGDFKEGYTMDNAEIIEDSSVTVRKVMPSGVILSRKTPDRPGN